MQRARGVGKLWGYRKVEENWVSRPASAALFVLAHGVSLILRNPTLGGCPGIPKVNRAGTMCIMIRSFLACLFSELLIPDPSEHLIDCPRGMYNGTVLQQGSS